ncbi:unnamed protein product, partial [Meganyctiphanes norvegica]
DGSSRMDMRRYELRWTHHQSTVVGEVGSLYRDKALVDVTLACEDQRTYQAHKLVLSACSQYFQGLFARHSAHQHPIIFLKDVSGDECEALLTYMYRGEVSVSHDQIHRILRVANSLQVRGLADMETSGSRPSSPLDNTGGHCASSSPSPSTGPPTKCATPISEPQSPNPPPLVNPSQPPLGGGASATTNSSIPSHHPLHDSLHPHHVLSAAASLVAQHPHAHPPLPPDFPSHYPLLPPRPYDLPPASLLSNVANDPDVKREDKGPPVSLPTSSFAPQVRVKPDLGVNRWESPPMDVGVVSPLDSARHPYLPPSIFSTFLQHEQHVGSQAYGRMFPISDPLRRLDRLGSSGGETRIHKCQYCSRKFKRKDHLKTHIRIHTGERPYKCKVCGRGFIQSQQVKIHMKVHVREDGGTSGLGSSSFTGTCWYQDPPGPGAGLTADSNTDLGPPDPPGGPGHPPEPDSDNECSSEMAEGDYDIAMQLDGGGGGGSGRTPPMSLSSSGLGGALGEHKTPSPQSPVSRSHPIPPPPPDDQSCGAMSLKESFHIGSNIKK